MAALAAAVRAVGGRGAPTVLATRLPSHFGVDDPLELAQAFHLGALPRARVGEICPLVFASRNEDEMCGAIAARLVSELVGFVRAAMARLSLCESDADVVLGGGCCAGSRPR